MASLRAFLTVAIVAVSVHAILATEYVVGDAKGWSLNFNYQAWAEGKEFHVGDKLVFKYAQGAHNVLRVDGTAFQQCAAPATIQPLTTGNDVITLATPGPKWYICGVGKHCESGNMKFSITVLPQVESPASPPSDSPVPSPNLPSAASSIALSKYYALMIGVFGIVLLIMV
ncbi:Uclacyanin 1 like [Actinidia chinensis var. chinensis]|uniref:Uclacyanin 1 like n=1 Tax=Actinidia chinensis var. chinensis TaxID=1590841 RepID=A0A2R6Q8D1_ACTCC|nr:Uclacyanin 1 like [Actinidia chinensis var. chinensis]